MNTEDARKLVAEAEAKLAEARKLLESAEWPREGQEVWVLHAGGYISPCPYAKAYAEHLAQGNLFPTEEAAEAEREKRRVEQVLRTRFGAGSYKAGNYSLERDLPDGPWKVCDCDEFTLFGELGFRSQTQAQAAADWLNAGAKG